MDKPDKQKIRDLVHTVDFDLDDSFNSFVEQMNELLGVNFWREEGKKAFQERDSQKSKIRNLENIMNTKLAEIKRNKNRSVSDSKLLEYQVISEAKKMKAYNPSQIFRLLKDEFQQSETGDFYIPVTDENGNEVSRKTVQQHLSEFLNDPNNDNLIEADTKGGTGHFQPLYSTKQGKDRHGKPKSRKKFSQEILEGAQERGLSPEDWSQILDYKREIQQQHGKQADKS
jgi:hypothetical protein